MFRVTDLAISIKVGIEASTAFTIGGHVHQRRYIRVILREEDIKQEAAPIIGCPLWP